MSDAPLFPPYFDVLFARLAEGDPATTAAFGRHVHWGYWPNPADADGTPDDYARAAELLCRRVCDAADVRDGRRVLDVGCGFGGTIAGLNERFTDLELVGVNIDPRQLERARATVAPQPGNRIRFVEADACALTFEPGTFDVVLAVECIFHFADRAAFFSGAARSLVAGGRMAISDFVPPAEALPLVTAAYGKPDRATLASYGRIDVLCSAERYRKLAAAAGLELTAVEIVTPHTLPTYPFLREQMRTWPDAALAKAFARATSRLEAASHKGMLDYAILSFRKPPV